MKTRVAVCLAVVLPTISGGLGHGSSTRQVELAEGVQRVKDGEFEEGLLTLDAVARRLAAEKGRSKELAQAYVYLAVAFLGLDQERLARAKFRLALEHDGELGLSAEEFPPKVLRVFEIVRIEMADTAALENEAKKGRGKGALILLGIGGAAAGGIALALSPEERTNTAPTASISITPEGQAIVDITRMAFSATATDAEGDPLQYTWDLGDGSNATGPTVTHVFTQDGSFNVSLTVRDGLTHTTATATVVARTLSGWWRVQGSLFHGLVGYRIGECWLNGCDMQVDFGNETQPNEGILVEDPRRVSCSHRDRPSRCRCAGGMGCCDCNFYFEGQVDPTLQTITGTLLADQYTPPSRCEECCDILGQRLPITLTRQ